MTVHDTLELDTVVFNGPVRTGWRVDLQHILSDTYGSWREFWASAPEGLEWEGAFPRSRENRMLFDADDYTGTGSAGHVAHLHVRPETHLGRAIAAALAGRLDVTTAELQVFDFGICTVTVGGRWVGAAEHDLGHAIAEVEGLSSILTSAINPHLETALQTLGDWLASFERDVGRFDEDVVGWLRREATLGALHGESPPMCIQWLHRLLSFHGEQDASDPYPDHDLFRHGQEMPDELFRGGKLWVGHGTSVVMGPDPREAATRVTPLLGMANAFEAGCRELGGLVLKNQQDVARLRRGRHVDELERVALSIVELHDELSLFRIMWREQVGLLPVDGRAIVTEFSATWGIEQMLEEIRLRGEDLSRLHDQALRRIQADEASRLNFIVTALTFFSIAQVIAELVEFTNADGPLSTWNSIRVLFLVLIGLALALLAVTARSRWIDAVRRMRRR